MIDSVPWTPPDPGRAKASAEPGTDDAARAEDVKDDDAVGLTISRAQQKEILRQLSSDAEASPKGPTVHVVRCPSGHPNPAHAGECRICKEPIQDQSPVTLPEADPRRAAFFDWGRNHFGPWRADRKEAVDDEERRQRPAARRQASKSRTGHLEKSPRNTARRLARARHGPQLHERHGDHPARPDPERLRPDQPTMIEPGTVVDLAEVSRSPSSNG